MPHSRTTSTRALAFALSAGFLSLAACDAGDPTSPLEAPVALSAAMGKTDVCHRTTDGNFTKISVADAAYETHIAHGDGGIGDPVPGIEGYAFDHDCQPVQTDLQIIPSTITAGEVHSCGLDLSGIAYCWGYGSHGRLGNGTTDNQNTPVAVAMPTGVSFAVISAGYRHTVALSSSGEAYAWGSNGGGQVGAGTVTSYHTTPMSVIMPAGVTFASISAGLAHTVALASTGEAYAWGKNTRGELGNGSGTNSNTPVAVTAPVGVSFTSISAGGGEHSVALTSTGVAYAWGRGDVGQLGNGTLTDHGTPSPVTMPSGVSFAAISAGSLHTAAITAAGDGYGWGWNGRGQLGNGTIDNQDVPAPVTMPDGVNFTAISPGVYLTTALTSTGVAYAWGWNVYGALGTGTAIPQSTTPVAVLMPDGVSFTAIATAIHTVAIGSTGAAYAWGHNTHGQLGDGSNDIRTTPVEVTGGIVFDQ
jgi:alpha-tubulin suppressor-like RCC1 family protein